MMRLLSCPFSKIEPFIPKKGAILDFGCGFGCFTHYLQLTSYERNIIGCDTAEDKIAQASSTINKDRNIRFHTGSLDFLEKESLDCIVIIDVLYLIPQEDWRALLDRCYFLLKTGGGFLLKEMDKEPLWKFRWNNFQETLSVKIFKVTTGSSFKNDKQFYFKSSEELSNDLTKIGFRVEVVRVDKGYIHPHILYLCRKV